MAVAISAGAGEFRFFVAFEYLSLRESPLSDRLVLFKKILPRLEYLWVICSVLTLNLTFIKRRLKKAVEISAGGIKGILLLFSDFRPDERTSVFFKKVEGHFLDRFTTKRRFIIEATYYLATKHPHMIAMAA